MLDSKGFTFVIKNCSFSIYKDEICYGIGRCINDFSILYLDKKNYHVDNSKSLKSKDSNHTYLWHYRLGHLNEKHIQKLYKDGQLDSFYFESYDVCESCLLRKMTKSP